MTEQSKFEAYSQEAALALLNFRMVHDALMRTFAWKL